MRVNVQLIDAETGAHLWAERFDKPVANLFDMQDEIVSRLANQLSTEIASVEARRAERTPNPDSLDFWFRGVDWINKGVNPESLTKARECFVSALDLDPDNVARFSEWSLSMRSSPKCTRSTIGRAHRRAERLASRRSFMAPRPRLLIIAWGSSSPSAIAQNRASTN